ncbi:N-acetylmuramoyl-L-alanine amidase [Paenisporosarcina sp. OV554]|nr:N-acetylmuramoyl-L-alanine amidase [Paenisporosarcina sp. OV554]
MDNLQKKWGEKVMVKIVLDAGHGLSTPGKRTPSGESEWSFNDKVVLAAINKLREYENVDILRVDDPTGKTDISLNDRTNKANAFNADVYIACHHNANTGTWGPWTGIEIYTYDHPQANPKSEEIAKVIHPLVVKAVGIQDRGLKKQNFHVLRETSMPAILIEGGFMDSYIDINVMRDNSKLEAHGEAIAAGLVQYFGLKLKVAVKNYLSIGDTGKEVKQLQENLIKVGFKLDADSNFGPITENAVKAFKTSNGLLVDGLYGPATKAKLENAVKPKPIPKTTPPKGTLYTVQVGVFSDKEHAERLAKELKSIGYSVYIIES